VQTAEFFEVVLPAQGLRCVAILNKNTHGFVHKFYGDSDAAAEVTRHLDKRGDVPVYFACASFLTDVNRKGDNVAAVRSFWLDLDCGADKPYPQQSDAIKALAEFRRRLNLPLPYLVDSGRGLHAYWPMDADMTPDEWRDVANDLKMATRVLGLQVDQSRTADIASVLRAVGTHHRKGEPKEVRLLREGVISSLDTFREALHEYHVESPVAKPFNSYTNGASTSLNGDLSGGLYVAMPNAAAIAERCGVLALVRDTQGNVDQPTWYHALGIIGFCEDGQALAHEWSVGHPKYTPAETATKLNQVMGYKPTTCAKFEDTQPAICAACPNYRKLVSPIKLGYEARPPQALTVHSAPASNVTVTIPRVDLPFGYSYKTDNHNPHKHTLRRMMPIGENKALEAVSFCNTLFYPVARIHTEQGMMLELEMRQRKGNLKRFSISCATIAEGGRSLASELGKHEIVAYPGLKPQIEAYMTTQVDEIKESRDEVRTHNHFGWFDDSFLIGNTLVTPDDQINVLLNGNAATKSRAFVPEGDFETWRDTINAAYNYDGQEALQYMVLMAFAAPLFSLFKELGGVTVYAYSQGSGVGKTTAQRAGLSAWGDWRELQLADGKATENALWALVGTYCNLPIVVDELTNQTSAQASALVYSVSQGEPKQRCNADGTLKENTTKWSTILMASGNSQLSEKISRWRTNSEAELSRAFEFTVPDATHLSPNEARELFPKLLDNHGHAGLIYIDYVVKNRARVEAAIKLVQASFNTSAAISQKERFWSVLQATALTALRICNKLGILSFSEPKMRAWITQQVGYNREVLVESISDSIETFGRMLNEMWLGILVTKGEGDKRKNLFAVVHTTPKISMVGRVIIGMTANERDILLLNASAVKDWCVKHNASAKDMFDSIVAKGWCEPTQERHSLGKGVTAFEAMSSQVKCWKIDYNKMGQESVGRSIAQRLQLIETQGIIDNDTTATAAGPGS
jgi:hypothetical protein